ncbi:uncharacterized protein [Drosophila takahashii]|uniref:uncharacterized protein n=1 Tax=Drosophila takahashii TaxID=29030 RepID=UPI001CF9185C|nr:uncharacterized protein LOC108058156 [Drosophila takahashii]
MIFTKPAADPNTFPKMNKLNITGPRIERWMIEIAKEQQKMEMKKTTDREVIIPKVWNNRAKMGLYYKLRREVDIFNIISDEMRQKIQTFYVEEEEEDDQDQKQKQEKQEEISMPENEEKQRDQPRKTAGKTTPTLSRVRLFLGSLIVKDITKQIRGLITKCEDFIEEEERTTMPPMSLMPSHLKWEPPNCVSTLIPSRQAPKLKKKDVLRVIQGRPRYN